MPGGSHRCWRGDASGWHILTFTHSGLLAFTLTQIKINQNSLLVTKYAEVKQMHLETYRLMLVSESPRTNLHRDRYQLKQALVCEWTYVGVFISLHCCLQYQFMLVSAVSVYIGVCSVSLHWCLQCQFTLVSAVSVYIGVCSISLHWCLHQLTLVSPSASIGVKINQQSELCTMWKADASLHLWGSTWRHWFSMHSTSKHGLKP